MLILISFPQWTEGRWESTGLGGLEPGPVLKQRGCASQAQYWLRSFLLSEATEALPLAVCWKLVETPHPCPRGYSVFGLSPPDLTVSPLIKAFNWTFLAPGPFLDPSATYLTGTLVNKLLGCFFPLIHILLQRSKPRTKKDRRKIIFAGIQMRPSPNF